MRIEYKKTIRHVEAMMEDAIHDLSVIKNFIHSQNIEGEYNTERKVEDKNRIYLVNCIEDYERKVRQATKELLLAFNMKPEIK